ncbi:kinase [candidate division KSB1 bacterium]|nr:kinase [candidate division KSB1 bacterium]
MIISRTPFRISLFGGGTDYPAWYMKHGGSVLASTIDKYCYLSCRYLPPFFEHRIRVVYSKIENAQTYDEIKHPSVREVLRFLEFDRGVEIHHDGDLPARSGMGTSSSFTVGLLNALYALKGIMPSKYQLASESLLIEQQIMKEVVGSQDQISAAYGGVNHIEFYSNGEFSVRPVTVNRERLDELNSHLMLFYTGIKRTAANIAVSYVTDIDKRKRQLRIMKDLVKESIAILSSGEDIDAFGELLREAWDAKRDLSDMVSNPEVDAIYEAAQTAGAIGGKLTGAGGGGFLLLFVPPAKQVKVKKSLQKLIHVPFNFEFFGSQIIFFDPETDYSKAELARARQPIQSFKELQPEKVEAKS